MRVSTNETRQKQNSHAPGRRLGLPTSVQHPVLALQGVLGNQGVHRLLYSGMVQATLGNPHLSLSRDLALRCQPKIRLSAPTDPAEQEADRIADQITASPRNTIHRTCAACVQHASPCSKCEEEQRVQRTVANPFGPAMWSDPAGIGGLGSGAPMDLQTRNWFEPRLGADLSPVRIHTGATANRATEQLDARAFALGSHIAFADGEYAPQTNHGRRLLAHELVHVLQDHAATMVRREERGEPLPPGGTSPASPGVCGPDVDAELTRVWTKIQSDFGGFNDSKRRDACLFLIEPIITVTPTPAGPVSGHSAAGLGILDLARAAFEGLTALDNMLSDLLRGSLPSATDVAALDSAAATAATAAQTMGTDLAARIDRLLSLSRSIAEIARAAPAIVPPLKRIIASIRRGSEPSSRDLFALAVAAGSLADSVIAMVLRLATAADVVIKAIGQITSGAGAVVAVDTILRALGIKLNRDAFDIIGLFQGSMSYTRDPAFGYHPTCATPGSPNPSAGTMDPVHETRNRCSNTVQVGGSCWLSGTPNYGTYGIMMRACFDWTASTRAPADMQRFKFAFSRHSTELFARSYKALDADSPSAPGDWALATFDAAGSGPGARVGGGNRPNCAPTCGTPYRRPGRFNYVWEPVKPRAGANFT